MREMTSRLNVVLFLWMLSLKLCCCYNVNCDYTESYDEIVTVSEKEPVQITYYGWCINIPPRCPNIKHELRSIEKNKTVTKSRIVRRCCKDQIQLENDCVPKCTDQCPNIQCEPETNKCKCRPGYQGSLCKQKCDVGLWGVDCKNYCHNACADCDHRTGCCNVLKDRNIRIATGGLTICGTSHVAIPETTVMTMTNVQTSTAAELETQKLVNKSLTDAQVTEYKYDELVKKLIWITVMAVIAIAMVFIIMFVVFFNYYGMSKVDEKTRNRRSTSTTADKIHETCITTPNCHVLPDICIKNSSIYKSANDNLPLQHEIFSPVFSAPHYTNLSTLYDSPQPLYEVLY